jgi:hypothetical protein
MRVESTELLLQVEVKYDKYIYLFIYYFLSYKDLTDAISACLFVEYVLPSFSNGGHSHMSHNSINKCVLSSNLGLKNV